MNRRTAMYHNEELAARAASYGVSATGAVVDHRYHEAVSNETLTLAEVKAAGGTITRLRLLRERGCFDISYCHATLADGRMVRVSLAHCPQANLVPVRRMKGVLIAWAAAEGVYAKGLGLLDESNWAVLNG